MDIAAFKPETAKVILDVVNYLVAAGFVDKPGSRSPQFIPPQAPIYIKNDTGEEIPAFGCVQISGTVEDGGQNYLEVVKPVDTSGTAGWYVFNGLQPIEIGGFGIAYDGPLARMLTDGSAIVSGEKWGPTVGSFAIEPGGSLIVAAGPDDIATNVMRGFLVSAPSDARIIEYLISSVTTSTDPIYAPKKVATVVIQVGPPDLIGETVSVVDHSGQIFDIESMNGYTGWGWWTQARTMDLEDPCATLTPFHWAAFNRVCEPNQGTYRECP